VWDEANAAPSLNKSLQVNNKFGAEFSDTKCGVNGRTFGESNVVIPANLIKDNEKYRSG